MADALQDITTLAGAFGSFTQSLATLHATKVRVEKSLRYAQIERANNDFLQRFNLAYDDPNRLTSTNWMDALKEHDSSIEEFLVQTRGGKAVDAEVRADLMPITEGFTTTVGNKMITAYREETQATQLKVGDEILNGGGTQREKAEKLKAWNNENVSAGYYDPTKQNEINNMVRSQLAVADADDLLTEYGSPIRAMENMPKDLDSLEGSAMHGYLKGKQDAMDSAFDASFNAQYVEKAKAEVLEVNDSSNWSKEIYRAYENGEISREQYNKAVSKVIIYGRKSTSADIVGFGSQKFDLYGSEWTRAQADDSITEIMQAYGPRARGSVELQKQLAETIAKFNAAAPSEGREDDDLKNSIQSRFYLMQNEARTSKSGITQAGLLSYLHAQISANPTLGLSSWADDMRSEIEAESGIKSGPLDISMQREWATTAIVDPAVTAGTKKQMEDFFDNKSGQDLLVKAKMSSIMMDTSTAYYNWLAGKPGASQSEKKAMFQELFKASSTVYKYAVEPIKTNLFGSEQNMAAFQSIVDSGALAPFSDTNMYGNTESATSLALAAQSVKNRFSTMIDDAKKNGTMDKNVVLRTVVVKGDTYLFDDTGRWVYDQTTVGGKLVIKKARTDTVPKDKHTDKAYLDGLTWEIVNTAPAAPAVSGGAAVSEFYGDGGPK